MLEYKEHITSENSIGQGSTRVSYVVGDYVVKLHKSELGRLQSVNEHRVYEAVRGTVHEKYFNPIYHVDSEIQVCKLQKPYPVNEHLWDVDGHLFEHNYVPFGNGGDYDLVFCESQKELENLLESLDIQIYDMLHGSNISVAPEGHLIFIDYGLTESMLDMDWSNEYMQSEVHCGICGNPLVERQYINTGKVEVDICEMCR